MRAILETIVPDEGASWTLLNRRLEDGIPFEWHHHPEYELTLTLNSRGHRYIGSDVDDYGDGDLVLIGPGVPHSWSSRDRLDPERSHVALVVWFRGDWAAGLLGLFPELRRLKPLLIAAAQGVSFGEDTRAAVRPLIEAMPASDPEERLLLLMQVFLHLCRDEERAVLANLPLAEGTRAPDADVRFQRVLDHLHRHFDEPVAIPVLADLACVSLSAFHRMFQRHTRMTALEYVARLRIGRACSLLLDGDRSVAWIAGTVGYGNLSLFNRQFRALKGVTPSAFRKRHQSRSGAPSGKYLR